MPSVQLYEIPPSPNNIKVRIALNYKGIPFERIPVNPQDRSPVIEASGQPLTPVLVDEGRAIFDSSAILRWIDANWRQGPRLFSEDIDTMVEIEAQERFARNELVGPVVTVFNLFRSEKEDPERCAEASHELNELTARYEDRLASHDWLVGDSMTAADIVAVPIVNFGMVGEAAAASSPIVDYFRRNLDLGEGRNKTRAWVERVMAYDR